MPMQTTAAFRNLLLTDIDGTLLGGESGDLCALRQWVEQQPDLGFGVVTGRCREAAYQGVKEAGFSRVDVVICAVGSEIYYGNHAEADQEWHSRQEAVWNESQLLQALAGVPLEQLILNDKFKITLQGSGVSRYHAEVSERLARHRLDASLILSHDYYLDVLPPDVDKASAISHVAGKLGVSHQQVLVAGDSANDSAMLTMPGVNAVLVGNHLKEVSHLAQHPGVYAAKAHHAAGIMEGVAHYRFHH